jgi:hypothetical protein
MTSGFAWLSPSYAGYAKSVKDNIPSHVLRQVKEEIENGQG